MRYEQIAQKVKSLSTRDPFAAAEEIGVTVLYAELPEVTKGVCYTVAGRRIILISSSLPRGEAEAVCAHELGHALLHPELNLQFLVSETLMVPGRFENEADMFASELLVDDTLLHQPEYAGMSTEQLSRATGIPERLLKIKFCRNLSPAAEIF